MGGVVYSDYGDGSLGKLGPAIAIGAGGIIPPGQFFGGAWSANIGGTMTAMAAGFIDSDGLATLTGAGNIYRIGPVGTYPWPWPPPWPLPGSGALLIGPDGRPSPLPC